MRIMVAPVAFGDLLTATQVAEAMVAGWRARAPQDRFDIAPLSDGGAGFGDAVQAARGGEPVPVTVSGPFGEPQPAVVLLLDDGTAVVEAGQACGPQLVAGVPGARRRAVRYGSSRGVGELVAAAVELGARRVVVGVGDTSTHDGGAGLLAGLGVGRWAGSLLGGPAGGGAVLDALTADDLQDLAVVRERLRAVELVVATAADLPLLGFHGASASDAERRGATADQAQASEASLGRFADLAQRALVAGRPLAGSGLASVPGAGAGGGVGFALLLLGARQVAAAQLVLDLVGAGDRLRRADLVLTGERAFGGESLRGGVLTALAARALAVGLPTVLVAATVEAGRRELMNLGISGAYPILERPDQAERLDSDPRGLIEARVRRVARTWSS